MNLKTGVLMIALSFLLGCQSDKSKDSAQKDEPVYCYVQSITKEQGNHFAEVIFINFLTGDEAVKAALKAGDASEDIDEDGKLFYSVPNDYFIEVEDERIYNLRISKKSTFKSWAFNDEEGMYKITHDDIDEFISFYDRRSFDFIPFTILIKDDAVIEIDEIYVP